jgi:hypothetical protein
VVADIPARPVAGEVLREAFFRRKCRLSDVDDRTVGSPTWARRIGQLDDVDVVLARGRHCNNSATAAPNLDVRVMNLRLPVTSTSSSPSWAD